MAGLDIAAGYRPSVPVNKKKRTSAYDLETADRISKYGTFPGSQPRSEAEIGNIAQGILDRESAEDAYPSTNAGIMDFRSQQAARDRAAGLNIGRRTGGQGINPMMPGAAGMGTGPSTTAYGGQGARANYYINRENDRYEDPRGTERMGRLMSENFYGGSGNVISKEDAVDLGSNAGFEERRNALKAAGGLSGAARMGFLDRFVSGGPSQQMTDEQRQGIIAARDSEKARKEKRLGDMNDPTTVAGRMLARGQQKAVDRQQRMAGSASGGGMEQQLMIAAANGNPNAMAMLGMIAQGNRETAVEDRRGRNAMELGSLNADTAKYGYDAQKDIAAEDRGSRLDISKGSTASAEKIAGMEQESARLQREQQVALNEGNLSHARELQKMSNDLELGLAKLRADSESEDRRIATSPEGRFQSFLNSGGDVSTLPGGTDAMSRQFGLTGSTPALTPTQAPIPPDAVGLEGTELRDHLARGGYSRSAIEEILKRTNKYATYDHPSGPGVLSPIARMRGGQLPKLPFFGGMIQEAMGY